MSVVLYKHYWIILQKCLPWAEFESATGKTRLLSLSRIHRCKWRARLHVTEAFHHICKSVKGIWVQSVSGSKGRSLPSPKHLRDCSRESNLFSHLYTTFSPRNTELYRLSLPSFCPYNKPVRLRDSDWPNITAEQGFDTGWFSSKYNFQTILAFQEKAFELIQPWDQLGQQSHAEDWWEIPLHLHSLLFLLSFPILKKEEATAESFTLPLLPFPIQEWEEQTR